MKWHMFFVYKYPVAPSKSLTLAEVKRRNSKISQVIAVDGKHDQTPINLVTST